VGLLVVELVAVVAVNTLAVVVLEPVCVCGSQSVNDNVNKLFRMNVRGNERVK